MFLGETKSPVLMAAHHGYYHILEIFKDSLEANFGFVEARTGYTPLHAVFLRSSPKSKVQPEQKVVIKIVNIAMCTLSQDNPNSDYVKCVNFLLDDEFSHRSQIDETINFRTDFNGDTALHLATQQPDQDSAKKLLARGASLSVKNNWGRTPADIISPKTLEEFLDECIVGGGGGNDGVSGSVTFHYDFLKPPMLNGKMWQDKEQNPHLDLPETEVNALIYALGSVPKLILLK